MGHQFLKGCPRRLPGAISPPRVWSSGTKKPSVWRAFVARPERFELPTFGSVDRRSIQLSYGREVAKCSRADRSVHPSSDGSNDRRQLAGQATKTERAGFEPAIEVSPHTRLAGECLQPLGHLSGALVGS
jgi:hypothetical protein